MTATAAPSEESELLALADRVLRLPRPARERFMLEQHPDDLAVIEHAILLRTDPGGRRVYRQLGYEPICIPRVRAAAAAGHRTPAAAAAAGVELPAPCGACPQEQFDQAAEFDVFYGGAAGGGKTMGLIMLAVRLAVRWPGFRCLFLRETFDDLDENVFPVLRNLGYCEEVGGRWNAGRHELNFTAPPGVTLPPTGESAIRFRYMENLKDLERRQGGGYQLVCMDERTLLPPGTADGLLDRLRSVNGIPVVGLRSTGNPGGRAHGELKAGYVLPTDHGRQLVPVVGDDGRLAYMRRFIPAKATDNPYLNEDYYTKTLGAIKDPARRRAMQDGDWDVFSGQFFAEWRHDRHVVPASVELPEGWRRYAAVDYGYAAPWCVLWAAEDQDGRVWLYRELYDVKVGEREQAARIVAAEQGEQVQRAGDPSMWAKAGDADSIAETYRKGGVYMEPADNNRLSGWARVHSALEEGTPCLYHRAAGWAKCPRLHVIEGRCPNLVRTLPDLPFDRKRVEDLDCFVAGTLVDTPSGRRAVETIQVGDVIDTPIGPRAVLYAGVSGVGPVMTVQLDNGDSLTGTPDHCVVTHNRGLVALNDLRPSDILATRTTVEGAWRNLSSDASRSSTTGSVTPARQDGPTTGRQVASRSTGRSSSTTTAPSLPGSTSTTSTMTTTTTTPQTSMRSRLLTMLATIWSSAAGIRATTSEPTPATEAPRGEQRPESAWSEAERTRRRETCRAEVVALLSSPSTRPQPSARSDAPTTMSGERGICAPARSAAPSLAASGTRPTLCRPARIVAAGSFVADAPVYRLTIDEVGLYYANGVCVTNTTAEDHAADALRYLIGLVGQPLAVATFPGQV